MRGVFTFLRDMAPCSDYRQARYQESEELYRRSLDIRSRYLGEHHPDTARSFHGARHTTPLLRSLSPCGVLHSSWLCGMRPDLAMICLAQSKYAEAEDLNERALAIREKVFGKTHVRCALIHIT
jgi:hypothetical protein